MSELQIVNPVPLDELEAWTRSMYVTFLATDLGAIGPDAEARRAEWEPDRAWGARAGNRWVATLRTLSSRLTLPGTSDEVVVDALTHVTVAATHRRQGLLRRMLTDSLAAAKDRGDAASILVAAEWPIYGRYGYAPAVQSAHYTLHTRRPGARLTADVTGTLRDVETAEFGELAPVVFSSARTYRAANIERPTRWWLSHLGLGGLPQQDKTPWIRIVHEGRSGIDGYLSWAPVNDWDETGELARIKVDELVASSAEAYLALWGYLLGMDVVDQVDIRYRPVDEPLPWLLVDGRVLRETYRGDRMWLRLLDVPMALSARRYAVADRLVFDVIDDDTGGYAAGRFALDAGPEHAECTSTRADPDLRLSQRALAAAYLGGFTLSEQFLAGQVEQLRPGAVRRADAMLAAAMAPWCGTGF